MSLLIISTMQLFRAEIESGRQYMWGKSTSERPVKMIWQSARDLIKILRENDTSGTAFSALIVAQIAE